MIKRLKTITIRTVAAINVAVIVMMLFVGYSDRINPVEHSMLANSGLMFPGFLVVNFGFLIFWLIFKTRMSLVPILGFIVCYVPVRKYSPLNISRPVTDSCIKVLSYNVWLFAGWDDKDTIHNDILDYIVKTNADIVCLQEAAPNEVKQEKIDRALNPIYKYRDTMYHDPGMNGDCVAIYSKYPVIKRERIEYESVGNQSVAYYLKIDKDTVLVVNNHMETVGLSKAEKSQFKQLVNGDLEADTAEKASKSLLVKLAESTKKRAPAADAVARYIAKHKDMPIIVCGDFNDSPISYTHRTIADGLIDCYVETGNGPGISYHHSGFYVRIDNILCSYDFEPLQCYVDNKIQSSDHYPIICWLKKRVKP